MSACQIPTYERRQPEKTTLYQAVEDNLEAFIRDRAHEGADLPDYVIREFREFLRCGRLEHGFVRVHCSDCAHDYPVALSCKKRGFCPSCCGKRMSETAAHLLDHVLPHAPYRQYVISLPPPLRYWVAMNKSLASRVHLIITSEIERFYKQKALAQNLEDPQTGSITFIQRSGSALNFNYHYHTLFLEGVYSSGETPKLTRITDLSNGDVETMLGKIVKRIIRVCRKRGLISDDPEALPDHKVDPLFEENQVLAAAMNASIKNLIAFGARAGEKVRLIGQAFGYEGEAPQAQGPLCYKQNGFSIHAATAVNELDRRRLEELVKYISRPPVANHRLTRRSDGIYVYKLKTPWRSGVTHIALSGEELLEKLTAIIPPPKTHLVKHSGVFSSHHRLRPQIILEPEIKKGFYKDPDSGEVQRSCWSRLLARTFKIDVTECPKCHGKNVTMVGAIFSPSSIARYLGHYGMGSDPPREEGAIASLELDYEEDA